jgi:hypothetical protein
MGYLEDFPFGLSFLHFGNPILLLRVKNASGVSLFSGICPAILGISDQVS